MPVETVIQGRNFAIPIPGEEQNSAQDYKGNKEVPCQSRVIILSPLFLIFRFYHCNHLPGIFQLPYHSELVMQLDNTIRILKNKCSIVYHTTYNSIMV
jgi:hypothetical protein